MEGAGKYSPAAAVPVKTKMPEPIIAPIPSAVRDQGPSVFFSRCSGASASANNLSMLLTLKSCEFTPTAGNEWRNSILTHNTAQHSCAPLVSSAYCGSAEDPSAAEACLARALCAHVLLRPGKIGVALHQLFRSITGETHGEPAVIVLAIHLDDRAHSISWMADTLADERIAAALRPRRRRNFGSNPRRALPRRSRRRAAHPAREFFGRVRVFGVRFIAARFARRGERSDCGLHEFPRDFLQKARGRRSMQPLAAVNAAVDSPRECKRFAGTRHAHVAQPAFLFEKGTAVGESSFFEAGQENVVELEALGGVQREQRDRGAIVEIVGIAHQRGTIEEIGKRLAALGAFGYGIHQLI